MDNEEPILENAQIVQIHRIGRWVDSLEKIAPDELKNNWQVDYEAHPSIRKTAKDLIKETELGYYLVEVETQLKDEGDILTVEGKDRVDFLEAVVIRFMNNRNAIAGVYLGDEEKNSILQLHSQGIPQYEIADQLRRGEGAVRRVLQEHGIKVFEFYTPEEEFLIREYSEEGRTDNEIGSILGRSSMAIQGKRYRMGVAKEEQRSWEEAEIIELKRLSKRGLTPSQIVESGSLDRGLYSIEYKIKKLNLIGEQKFQWKEQEFKIIQAEIKKYNDSSNDLEVGVESLLDMKIDLEIGLSLDRPGWVVANYRLKNGIYTNTERALIEGMQGLKRPDIEQRVMLVGHLLYYAKLSSSQIVGVLGDSVKEKYVSSQADFFRRGTYPNKDKLSFNKAQEDYILQSLNNGVGYTEIARDLGTNARKIKRFIEKLNKTEQ